MDRESELDSVDTEASFSEIARCHRGDDPRLQLHLLDGAEFLTAAGQGAYDLIFADAWPGKYSHLNQAIAGLMIDDMLPQPNWPEGHDQHATQLRATRASREDLCVVELACSTGLILATGVA